MDWSKRIINIMVLGIHLTANVLHNLFLHLSQSIGPASRSALDERFLPDVPAGCFDLFKSCLAAKPEERPSFAIVSHRLRTMLEL